MSEDDFYRAFEERYYAPREVIRILRQVYLPFVEPLKTFYGGGNTCDIGCGRGEWLELMEGLGFEAYGVDLDDGMLQDCYERGLPASKGDGIAYIQSLPDQSQVVVSAFHVVEHISFSDLQKFIQEALRVLKPGGLLIMETPNPENIRVATANFHLDPTHVKPIPPLLLTFLPEYYGFYRTKLLRLQESSALRESEAVSLLNVLNDVSPDYAVIAQKAAPESHLSTFNGVFEREYGLKLDTLAMRYDALTIGKIQKIEIRLAHLEKLSLVWRIDQCLRRVYRALRRAVKSSLGEK